MSPTEHLPKPCWRQTRCINTEYYHYSTPTARSAYWTHRNITLVSRPTSLVVRVTAWPTIQHLEFISYNTLIYMPRLQLVKLIHTAYQFGALPRPFFTGIEKDIILNQIEFFSTNHQTGKFPQQRASRPSRWVAQPLPRLPANTPNSWRNKGSPQPRLSLSLGNKSLLMSALPQTSYEPDY